MTPATDSGRPASSAAMRATLRLSSPAWFAQPNHTSSIWSAGTPERSTTARIDERGEIVRAHAGERAAVAADRRAQPREDDGPAHSTN